MKVGISMIQVVTCANSIYVAPWPSQFAGFLDTFKVFLLDIMTITKSNCSTRLTYFQVCVTWVFKFMATAPSPLTSSMPLMLPWPRSLLIELGCPVSWLGSHCS